MQIKEIHVRKNTREKRAGQLIATCFPARLIPSWVLLARYISQPSKQAISPCFKKSNFNLTTKVSQK